MSWAEEIRKLEEDNKNAFLVRDYDRLDQLWADDFLVNSPINRVNNKKQVLELLKAGVIAHSTYETTIESLEKLGDVVVVMGAERVVNAPGTPMINRRFTNVWRPANGGWQVFIRHANIIAGG